MPRPDKAALSSACGPLAALDESDRRRLEPYARHIEAMLADLAPDPELDPSEVSDAVISLAGMEFGTRPGRLTVGPYRTALTQ
jgi:hypothetical protein